jgi:predicted RNA-binding protein with PUA-like domain
MVGAMAKYWLMKSEPEQFGIADLARVKVEPWTGVRSFFARAYMRQMSVGDPVLFHHSNATPPGVAGLARVVRTGVVDETQFDPASKYYVAKATRDQPIWDCVEVEYVATLPHFVSMDRLRGDPRLADMLVLRRGMRLSVQPVAEAEYQVVVELGDTEPAEPQPVAKPPRKPAARKPAVRQSVAHAARKPAARKPATRKPAARKPAGKPARATAGKAKRKRR